MFDDIYLASSQKVLKRLVDQAKLGERFRIYARLARWGTGQLDQEVSRGDWLIVCADAESLFDKAQSETWPEVLRRVKVRWLSF
ncbi:hypothetical protein NKDENANG_01695 [Candidatus Entotheonellaceae bacterium PAL068K]